MFGGSKEVTARMQLSAVVSLSGGRLVEFQPQML